MRPPAEGQQSPVRPSEAHCGFAEQAAEAPPPEAGAGAGAGGVGSFEEGGVCAGALAGAGTGLEGGPGVGGTGAGVPPPQQPSMRPPAEGQ
eukprot:CAMPEP_0172618676 /NCGR_PEP_ID=MMETSP1068-20121228/84182_1 /TAXON_ID=35684 /ORGANISM="Pseudopedinella elastica, Strain CCMP716" /LENGTH=90 /DNA_ID=CAMNT_0013425049 /DNA_START=14 /DNA_END=283 /DNA_ORIENTATION=-